MTKKAKLALIAALAVTRLAATPAFAQSFDGMTEPATCCRLPINRLLRMLRFVTQALVHSSEWARCLCDGAAPTIAFRSTYPDACRFRRSDDHWRRQRRLQRIVAGRTLRSRRK